MKEELVEQLSQLFDRIGRAHHQAFSETDGFHPDWPMWYAERLHADLSELLQAKFTLSELIYLIVLVDKEHRLQAPGADWPRYYARFFLERYT